MGFGTRAGGLGVARYLAEQGAIVTVTDLRTEQELAVPLADLAGLPIRYVLGRHDAADFTEADVVVRNPGVRRSNLFLTMARNAGVRVEMEMTIFLRACPAPVIGITGTKGKTSTSAICGEMLRSWRPDTVVAGNMGVSAVSALARIDPETPVVLELSSWQLEGMDDQEIGPQIGVITNISEDHLDTYRDFNDYADTKRSLSRHIKPAGHLILNAADPEVARAAAATTATVIWIGSSGLPGAGVQVGERQMTSTIPGCEGHIALPENPALRGQHQRLNAAAAAAAALLRGATAQHVGAGLATFRGVENRMEPIAEIGGVLFVNDTAATAPAAAIASLRAFSDRPIHLISGGADKQLDYAPLATEIARRATTVTLLEGTATGKVCSLIEAAGKRVDGPIAQSMTEAIGTATRSAQTGDVVLLSPGCASFGLFRDEFDRGDQFRAAVLALAGVGATA
jgi:UDP-N-acetylmuramoylalanine--D-glutamate ligase